MDLPLRGFNLVHFPMGYYINPPDMSKEDFLHKHGRPLLEEDAKKFDFASSDLPVCLVDNGWMTAAGIAYDAAARDVFADPRDQRPKKWFAVSKELLLPYYNSK